MPKCSNGVKVEFKESPEYFSITVGKGTWYWNKDTGKFDGTSREISED